MTPPTSTGGVPDGFAELEVDATLALDLSMVEGAVDAYLATPDDVTRDGLIAQLAALDEQTAASDAFEISVADSAMFGFSSKGSVIGETRSVPLVEVIPSDRFELQVALVRAAKREVAAPTPQSMDALRAARAATLRP